MKRLSHRNTTGLPRFLFGADYYPEHWTPGERARDAGRMARASFNVVRMAEFAWDRMEPEEGRFDFGLFDETIARLGRRGIRTILGTPTAAPPRWLTAAYPEVLRVDANGAPLRHGSRQHACLSSPVFRAHARRIVGAMADHFRGRRDVIGWQTDNEIYCHFVECHCAACRAGFRAFLRRRYRGDIARLNRAWGAAFWAQTYGDFDGIDLPAPARPTHENPSQRLDYLRFLSDAAAAFQHEQVVLLRAAQPRWFVTHNGCFRHVDYRGPFGRDLDFLGYDVYPFFQPDPALRRFTHGYGLDRARSLCGTFIVPELQSGPGGQPPYALDHPEPGELRRLTWTTVARGADGVLYFRWRSCRFGAEEYWCGILDHDDVPRRRYREVAQVGAEARRVGPWLRGTRPFMDCAVVHGDLDAREASSTYSLGLPDSEQVAAGVHRVLARGGHAVGCVNPADDLSGLKLIVLPHLEIVSPAAAARLARFVRAGGTLVIGARSGTRNRDNHVVPDVLPGILRPLAGATVEEYGRQNNPAARPLPLDLDGERVPTEWWYEQLKPDAGTEVLARWTARHLAGAPAIVSRRHGRGRAVYAGTYLTEAVASALLRRLAPGCGLRPLWPGTPAEVEVVRRDAPGRRLWFFIHHGEAEVTIPRTPPGVDLLSGARTGGALALPARGVAVIRSRPGARPAGRRAPAAGSASA